VTNKDGSRQIRFVPDTKAKSAAASDTKAKSAAASDTKAKSAADPESTAMQDRLVALLEAQTAELKAQRDRFAALESKLATLAANPPPSTSAPVEPQAVLHVEQIEEKPTPKANPEPPRSRSLFPMRSDKSASRNPFGFKSN